jgi:tripartite-type tricarboxylate transporter receptor subunit TctC
VEQIKQAAGLDIMSVPYKSTAQAMSDVVGGQIPLYMPSFPAALGQLKSAQVRGLAIGSSKRSAVMPDIPTVAEVLKLPGFEASVWYGFLAPKGTPADVVSRLHAEISTAAASPQVTAMIDKLGAEAVLQAPREFAGQIQRDADNARKLLASLGVKPQ